ncbi:hypothetical protein EOM39_00115 [Candidatus Gracilibacteria bacterium]|nr:hypothetical protein [Candidatus Gracilibacteria bacterium]
MILKNNFIKFLIIGTISTIINYLVFYIFYKLGVYYIVSSSFGYISGLVLGYFLNKNYNFYLRNYKHTFYKYILVYSINLGFSQIILYCLVNELNISVYLGNFLIIIYTTFSNYIGLKYYVFRNKPLLTISICGNSGTGKSTLAKFFSEIIGENNLSILVGDSSHKWGRNNPNRGKITHLNPKGNNLKKEENDIKKIVNGFPIKRRKYDHGIGEHTDIISINSNTFI